MRAFPKPSEIEGKVTLSPEDRKQLKLGFFVRQKGRCCTCGERMTLEFGYPNTATLGHKNPEPMGAAKRDNPDNILGAQCFKCNFERGSKRG